jgi:hypothetical protein
MDYASISKALLAAHIDVVWNLYISLRQGLQESGLQNSETESE